MKTMVETEKPTMMATDISGPKLSMTEARSKRPVTWSVAEVASVTYQHARASRQGGSRSAGAASVGERAEARLRTVAVVSELLVAEAGNREA